MPGLDYSCIFHGEYMNVRVYILGADLYRHVSESRKLYESAKAKM